MSDEPQAPSEEELRAAWEEQLRQLTPADLIVQTVVSLINLAGRRLGLDAADERDLEQARDGIDGARALMPVLERREGQETLKPLRDALSALQFEYAKLAGSAGGDPPAQGGGGAPEQAPPAEDPAEGPGPAQRSGRLWVPGQ
jgi:hypothetical protein